MKMESRDSFGKSSDSMEEGSRSPNELYSQTVLPHPNMSLLQQSSLAEIHLQHQQLLQQFSLLHRNISNGQTQSNGSSPSHPLYSHGLCKWAGCDTHCQTSQEFFQHLGRCHILDDKSTAQTKVQIQIVEQLEQQLTKEQRRLEAMMDHLKHFKQVKEEERIDQKISNDSPQISPQLSPQLPQLTRLPFLTYSPSQKPNSQAGPVRKKVTDRNSIEGTPESYQRCYKAEKGSSLDVESEMNQNRDFYRIQDVRPPFTYAALIRQAINEANGRQLTLNEIYNWFQANFAFFRRNAATWKNAVRHNLSLHKCFSRVENVKGAVWTVDEAEFHRRRPQRSNEGNNNNDGGSPHSNPGYEDSFNRSIQNALFNLGKTGQEDFINMTPFGSCGTTSILSESAVSPPRMINNEYKRQNIFNNSTSQSYMHLVQNPPKSEAVHYEKRDDKEEDLEQQSVFNDSVSTESVSDIVEEKDDESVPQDLSMISHRDI